MTKLVVNLGVKEHEAMESYKIPWTKIFDITATNLELWKKLP